MTTYVPGGARSRAGRNDVHDASARRTRMRVARLRARGCEPSASIRAAARGAVPSPSSTSRRRTWPGRGIISGRSGAGPRIRPAVSVDVLDVSCGALIGRLAAAWICCSVLRRSAVASRRRREALEVVAGGSRPASSAGRSGDEDNDQAGAHQARTRHAATSSAMGKRRPLLRRGACGGWPRSALSKISRERSRRCSMPVRRPGTAAPTDAGGPSASRCAA